MNYRAPFVIILASLALGGCQGNPGGLSDREFERLSPDRKAELRMEQETLNEERSMRVDEQMDRYDRNSRDDDLTRAAEREVEKDMRGVDLSGLKK